MSDTNTITVTSGTGLFVLSETLLAALRKLGAVAHELSLQHGVLAGLIDEWALLRVPRAELPPAAVSAEHSMAAALQLLASARDRATALHALLRRAILTYESTDAVITTVWHDIQEQNAWSLGILTRMAIGPLLVGAAASVLFVQWRTGLTPAQQASAVGAIVKRDPGLITSPGFVRGVRGVVSNMDGFWAGFAGLPPGVASALGAGGLPASAAAVAGVGRRFGLFEESPVQVSRVTTTEGATAPRSLTDRINRIPDATPGGSGAQIRIDRYSTPGEEDRFDVYLAGTVTFDPHATTEPFDLTSDVVGVAQASPGAERAAAEAMQRAGVTSKTPVVLNGYSEGGLIATLLASSGDYNVKGLVTFGAPAGQVPVAAHVPVVTVRNTDDLVPATGGYDVNPHVVVVARRAFDGHDIPNTLVVPAHELPAYLKTVALADGSSNTALQDVLRPLDQFGSGTGATTAGVGTTHIETTLWRAVRTSAADDASAAGGPTSGAPAGGEERYR